MSLFPINSHQLKRDAQKNSERRKNAYSPFRISLRSNKTGLMHHTQQGKPPKFRRINFHIGKSEEKNNISEFKPYSSGSKQIYADKLREDKRYINSLVEQQYGTETLNKDVLQRRNGKLKKSCQKSVEKLHELQEKLKNLRQYNLYQKESLKQQVERLKQDLTKNKPMIGHIYSYKEPQDKIPKMIIESQFETTQESSNIDASSKLKKCHSQRILNSRIYRK